MTVYGAELVIYDKYKRCLLTEGDYEVALQEMSAMTYKKQASWETVMDGKVFTEHSGLWKKKKMGELENLIERFDFFFFFFRKLQRIV